MHWATNKPKGYKHRKELRILGKRGLVEGRREWESVVSGIQSEYSIDVNIHNGGLK